MLDLEHDRGDQHSELELHADYVISLMYGLKFTSFRQKSSLSR